MQNVKFDSARFFEDFQHNEPRTYAACYPRRIVPPNDYLNPREFAAVLRSQLLAATMADMHMLPHLAGVLHAFKHIEYGVQTYFVQSEFAQAVAQTKPPEDYRIGDIKWPLDAMLFVIPTAFSFAKWGYHIPFVSAVRASTGIYPDCVKLPDMECDKAAFNRTDNKSDRMILMATLWHKSLPPVDYSLVLNMDHSVADMFKLDFHDATYHDAQLTGAFIEYDDATMPTGETEAKMRDSIFQFTVGLLLAMVARPQTVQPGEQTRKPKFAHDGSVARDGLWSPNTIGWSYKAERINNAPAQGTHNSPRLHWRTGHMRNQAFGEGRAQRKLIWIEPVLVGESK